MGLVPSFLRSRSTNLSAHGLSFATNCIAPSPWLPTTLEHSSLTSIHVTGTLEMLVKGECKPLGRDATKKRGERRTAFAAVNKRLDFNVG